MSQETPAPRSSILYALGKHAAEVAGLSGEVARLREAQGDIPTRVVEALNPRLVLLETTSKDHSKRLGSLEKWRWLQAGGSAVIIVIAGFVIDVLKPGIHFTA